MIPAMRHTPAMIEVMEARQLMSATPAADAIVVESNAQPMLLLPAVQKVREAAAPSISEIKVTKPVDRPSTGL
jgi:hypothetical protein